MNVEQKNYKYFAKKTPRMLKGFKGGPFQRTKTFFSAK